MSNISQNDEKVDQVTGKKILYLITQTKWGGAQKYVLQLAEHFAKKNEVHIAYGQVKQADKKFLDKCQRLNIKTIPITYLYRDIDIAREYLSIIDIFKLYNKESYNLVHLNSSKAGLLGAVAAKLYAANPMNLKMRIVYTAHGFVFNEPLSKFKKGIYKLSEKISTGIQHMVIAVSEADRQSALDNKIVYEEKIKTIHNGLDPDKYNFLDSEQAKNKLNLPKDKKYFGIIASFYKTKGYQFLIEAITMLKSEDSPLLKEYSWVLIGQGPEMEKIKQQVKENNLSDYVIFRQTNNAAKYLKAFDCFVLPSVKEGLPYTVLEAGLAHIPIIASQVGGVPEIISDQKTGLLTSPANPLSLKNAMKKIVNNEELSRNIAKNNHQNIIKNFTLSKTIQDTEKIYSKLL